MALDTVTGVTESGCEEEGCTEDAAPPFEVQLAINVRLNSRRTAAYIYRFMGVLLNVVMGFGSVCFCVAKYIKVICTPK